MSNLLLTN